MRRLLVDLVVTVAVTFLAFQIYRGFLFPDPFLYSGPGSGLLAKLLVVAKISVVLAALLVLAVYFLVTRRFLSLLSLALIAGGILIALVPVYLAALHLYYKTPSAERLANYHPYLQLSPPNYVERKAVPGRQPIRIFFLGGSTTEWPDSRGKDWPSRVEQVLLPVTSNSEVMVFNGGREWYTVQQSLLNYELNLAQHKPDIVVIMHAVNDLIVNADFSWVSIGPFQDDYRHFLGPITLLLKRPGMISSILEKLKGAWHAPKQELIETQTFPGLPAFERKLRRLVQVVRLDGAVPVLMTEPYLYKADATDQEQEVMNMLRFTSAAPGKRWALSTALSGMQQYTAVIKSVALSTKTPLIDLEAQIPKTLEFIRDDVHFTDKAYPQISEIVAAGLQPIVMTIDLSKRRP